MKKVTKKQIKETLRTGNATSIFQIAAKCGVNTSNRNEVRRFIENNAPSKKIISAAYKLAYFPDDFKHFRCYRGAYENSPLRMPITDTIRFAKSQKKDGSINTNYGKILIEGNDHIYWASPVYKHSDYNKSVALKNTEKNRNLMCVINAYLMN